ncbi:glycosyltransferase family 4 protein [Geomonas sp. Red32]|uniref:glycosyltransferase family 4 protein n=1 Tax=Geomonas sp. Red32 TaxID=2912856 RepID=UPI00202CECAB|nr:glycosyltransferase family 4 protein [Geomonas sp. Red32]MCM0084051.1 glycosyltransferase family 4 protein [Geomonas sp. Red32]
MEDRRPLKIGFLAPFGIRPKGTVLARMIPLAVVLQELGNEVVIVAPPYTNPEDSGKIEIVRGVRLVNVELPTGGKVLSTMALAWRMLKAALAEGPDLLHLFKPKGYGGVAAMLVIALRSIGIRLPVVVVDTDDWEGKGGMNDLHGYSATEKRIFAFQEQWLTSHAEAVTAASRELMLMSERLQKRRVMYLPNCVDPEPLTPNSSVREQMGIPDNSPVVFLYTRFFEFSQEKLHTVFAEIHKLAQDVHFVVVGKGRRGEESLLSEAAVRLGFDDVLHIVGWVNPGDLPNYFALADVAIYPFADNLINRCKCPAKLTELLKAGVPVVADRVGQIAEYISDGEGGILCDPDDWGAMAVAVAGLLKDRERRRTVGAGGRAYLIEHFNWQSYGNCLQDFYHTVIVR